MGANLLSNFEASALREAVIRKLTECHGICDKRGKKNGSRRTMTLNQTRAVCADSLNLGNG